MNSMNTTNDLKMRNGVIPKTLKSNGLANGDKTVKRDSSKLKSNSQNDKVASLEWSCQHCTFLNVTEQKICEICSKSRDFFLDSDKNVGKSSATCV